MGGMDSLRDHARRRSSRDAGGTLRTANRLLLLLGALLFLNGIAVTLITVFIPVAISSLVIVTVVTGTVAAGYALKRSPRRIAILRATVRPVLSTLRSRNRSPRRQGGL